MIDEQYDPADETYEDDGFEEQDTPDLLDDPDEQPEAVPDMNAPLSRAEFFEAIKQFQQQAQQPQAQQFAQAYQDSIYDPTHEARQAIRLEESMMRDVRKMYPDLPTEALEEIQDRLGGYKTLESLQAAKQSKMHELLADAKASELFRKGQYVPASLKKHTATSPVHTERPRVPSTRTKTEMDRINAILTSINPEAAIADNDIKGKR